MLAQAGVTLGDLANHSLVQVLVAAAILAAVRSLWKISRAVTVELPAKLDAGDQRMSRIEAAAGELRQDLVTHMQHEEAEGAAWRSEVREQINDVRIASVASVARLIEAIESGDPVGPVKRTNPQGDD